MHPMSFIWIKDLLQQVLIQRHCYIKLRYIQTTKAVNLRGYWRLAAFVVCLDCPKAIRKLWGSFRILNSELVFNA